MRVPLSDLISLTRWFISNVSAGANCTNARAVVGGLLFFFCSVHLTNHVYRAFFVARLFSVEDIPMQAFWRRKQLVHPKLRYPLLIIQWDKATLVNRFALAPLPLLPRMFLAVRAPDRPKWPLRRRRSQA